MEKQENQNQLSGSELKTLEYVERIKAGESKDEIFKGLPESFKKSIEEQMGKSESESGSKEDTVVVDNAKLDQERYSRLSEDQKKEFPLLQKQASHLVAEYVKGTKEIKNLTNEERSILLKAADTFKGFQEKNPDAPITLKFGNETDKKVYANLLNKLAFEAVKNNKAEADKEELKKLRGELGITPKDGYVDEIAQEIKEVFNNLSLGANEGLKEDFEKKIQKYTDEIISGKEIKDVLQGLPKSFTEAVEKKLESKQNNIEKQVSVTFEKSELGFKGEIIINGKNLGDFSLYNLDDNRTYIHDIQIGYDEGAPRNKGYGFEAYKKIIEELKKNNIKLLSTNFSTSNTSISPQALRVWEKLEKIGYAKKTGETEAVILDRFVNSGSETRIIPTYESDL